MLQAHPISPKDARLKICLKSICKSIKKSIAGRRFVFVSLYIESISWLCSNAPNSAKSILKTYIIKTAGINLKILNDVLFFKVLKKVAITAKIKIYKTGELITRKRF